MQQTENSALNALSLGFIEELYAEFISNPESVTPEWRDYFNGLSNGCSRGPGASTVPVQRPSRVQSSAIQQPTANSQQPTANSQQPIANFQLAVLQRRVDQIMRNYRVRGHMIAHIDPLGTARPQFPELDPNYYGFTEDDLNRCFTREGICAAGAGPAAGPVVTLREILERLRNTYCRNIGVQFMHIDDLYVREWLQDRMEQSENRIQLSRQEQIRILTCLTDAVVFEEFVQKKFIGAKSFSLEGAESLIPLMELAIEKAAVQGLDEIVVAMAHRGRLNVLANIIGKNPRQIFREFADAESAKNLYGGDVKYHLGHSNEWTSVNGHKIHLSLCFNPSHLEYVNPVALGRLRAKQDRVGDSERARGMVLLIHGDAAFAGEGIIQETLNLSELEAYTTGGTLHVIVNNQIGFITSPSEARSSTYATDVAKMLQMPIFHVNGEDPEAVAQVVRLAMDFRSTFKRDVVIDMYCYRRRGHSESDEPAFTQPLLYKAIEQRKPVREGYLDHLLKLGGVTSEEAEDIASACSRNLERELTVARSRSQTVLANQSGTWSRYRGGPETNIKNVETGVERARLSTLLDSLTRLPADFHPHPKIARGLELRRQMARGEKPLDWAAGEALAFASLATQRIRIRMSGQDSTRGTFSHRHARLHDIQDGHTYMPLQHVDPKQGVVEIYNSPLSEAGVLGFEYGYSLDCPGGLVLWEAQFGDFNNAAQVIIDQFIASAEHKWRRLSGLVLLLPHGFEGMGPEHSSARLERFLALASEDNFQVVNPTTPAQYFHCLRRQVLSPWRKPLVVMTPKSLLRHPLAVSSLDECAKGCFQRLIPDARKQNATKVKRVLMCSGKIYYELDARREQTQATDVAILRLEQLYPLSDDLLNSALAQYPDGTPVVWVQEEPENMGAWRYLRVRYGEKLLDKFPFSGVYRPSSSSPATGSASSHKLEQKLLLDAAFRNV